MNLLKLIVLDYGDWLFVAGLVIYAVWDDARKGGRTHVLAITALFLACTACTIDEMFPDPPRQPRGYYGAPYDPLGMPPPPVTQPWMGPDGRMSLCTTIPSNPPTTFCSGPGTPRGLSHEPGY